MRLDPFSGDAIVFSSLGVVGRTVLQNSRIETQYGQIVPNVFDWQGGDVVLFGGLPTAVGWIPKTITRVSQSILGASTEGSKWVHAGIYVGDEIIWDLQTKGYPNPKSVRLALSNPSRSFAIYRLKKTIVNTNALADAIQKFSSTTWSLRQAMLINGGPGEICSSYVRLLLRHAVSRDVLASYPLVFPSDFADSGEFECVESFWSRIEAS